MVRPAGSRIHKPLIRWGCPVEILPVGGQDTPLFDFESFGLRFGLAVKRCQMNRRNLNRLEKSSGMF